MRPEVLESNFYAWRHTGNVKYYERAVSAYKSFQTYLKTPTVAFAPINNVNELNSGFIDDMESFWFAEVLKYAYLIHADQDAEFQVAGPDGKNTWVFNTEAHPVRVSGI